MRELVGLTGSARNSAAHVKDGYFSAILIFFLPKEWPFEFAETRRCRASQLSCHLSFPEEYSSKDDIGEREATPLQYCPLTDVWDWAYALVTQLHRTVLQRILRGERACNLVATRTANNT